MSRLSANVGSFIGAVDDIRYPRLPVGRKSPSSMVALLRRSRRLDSSAVVDTCQSTTSCIGSYGRTIWIGGNASWVRRLCTSTVKLLMRNANDWYRSKQSCLRRLRRLPDCPEV